MDNTTQKSVYDFDISLQPDYSFLSVQLAADQKIFAEPSAMASMDSHIHMKAALKGGVFKSVKRMFGGESTHLPLKLNTAGVIPPIFASSLLLLPITVASFSAQGGPEWLTTFTALLGRGAPLYMLLYAAGIIFFCFFYTAIVFNPEETADNLKKNGGFIPGIRPGKRTEEYLDYVLTRITVIGAIYLTIVCVLPEYMIAQTGVPLFLGGTSLLIVVNVTVDTISQIQSHLLAHQYGDLIKKAKLKGRLR